MLDIYINVLLKLHDLCENLEELPGGSAEGGAAVRPRGEPRPGYPLGEGRNKASAKHSTTAHVRLLVTVILTVCFQPPHA